MRLRYLATLSLAVAAGIASSAAAGTVKLSNSTVGTNGGPFVATVQTGPIGIYGSGASFNTFCVELGEHFSPGTTYYAVESDRAMFGTTDEDPGPGDMLDPQTAYLYTNYMQGTMTSVVGALWDGSTGNLIALQDAIWELEGETVSTSGATAGLKAALKTAADAAVLGSWGNTIGNVRVMQLWTSASTVNTQDGKVQDHLVLVPTPQASLAGMSLLGVMGVMGFMKKRRKLQESELD